jgi:hypothetical protein
MSEARQEAEWQRTAQSMALLANCHRDPKKTRAFTAQDFMPRTEPEKVEGSIHDLKALLPGGRHGGR